MRDAEVAQVGHERARRGEAELAGRAAAGRWRAARSRRALAARTSERATSGTSARGPPAARCRAAPPGRRWTARAPSASPKRRLGSVNTHVLVVGVEQQQERVVVDVARRCGPGVGDLRAVEEHAEHAGRRPASRAGSCARPSARNHQTSGRPEPFGVLAARGSCSRRNTGCSRRSAISRRVNSTQLAARARRQLPVEPGDLVVLAPGVVVAALGAAHLVAAEQHRHALREQQRRQEVALLARAQLDDRGVVGRRPRRRSSRSGCRRCRRGCPRGWPRCASRCRRRGRAA